MDVDVAAEGIDHAGVAGEGGHDAEFDLRVVATEEGAAGRGDEGFADAAAIIGADGDVLDVGVGGGEAAGGGDELVKGGVDAAGAGANVGGEGIDVGGFELSGLAVGEDVVDDGVGALEGGEGGFVGFVLASGGFFGFGGELEFLEEDFAELLGGVEVEGGASMLADAVGHGIDAGLEVVADFS